jgi:hypothetical protein
LLVACGRDPDWLRGSGSYGEATPRKIGKNLGPLPDPEKKMQKRKEFDEDADFGLILFEHENLQKVNSPFYISMYLEIIIIIQSR